MDAYAERAVIDAQRDAALAYNTAAFTRAKKLPSLDTVLSRLKSRGRRRDKAPMPWQDMLAAARAWNKALGGVTKKKE